MYIVKAYVDLDGEATVEVNGMKFSALAAGSMFNAPVILDACKEARVLDAARAPATSIYEPGPGDPF